MPRRSLKSVCDEIKKFRRLGGYDLMQVKTMELGWEENHGMGFKTLALRTLQGI
jgi:hypothetical protein